MKSFQNIIIVCLIICYNCYNYSYVSHCNDSFFAENKENLSPEKCHLYDLIESSNVTCCYIKYGKIVSYTYYYYVYYKTKNQNHNHTRNLDANFEYSYSCIGLTREGYNNIKTLIEELKHDGKGDSIDIDCFSNYLKIFTNLLLILLF